MRYTTAHKDLTRKKILDAAARKFRADGYAGSGIDGLAKAAGVTNGGFYGHFASKADAFREVVTQGLAELREGIGHYRREHGPGWLAAFARFYFSSPKLTCPEDTCALPSFAPEMPRAPAETRAAFEEGLKEIAKALSEGLATSTDDQRDDKAWVALALLTGGVTLTRAVKDEALRARIVEALERHLQHKG